MAVIQKVIQTLHSRVNELEAQLRKNTATEIEAKGRADRAEAQVAIQARDLECLREELRLLKRALDESATRPPLEHHRLNGVKCNCDELKRQVSDLQEIIASHTRQKEAAAISREHAEVEVIASCRSTFASVHFAPLHFCRCTAPAPTHSRPCICSHPFAFRCVCWPVPLYRLRVAPLCRCTFAG